MTSVFTDNPAQFGLDLQLGAQLDSFGQRCWLEWDDENEIFWIEFESEVALRRHLA